MEFLDVFQPGQPKLKYTQVVYFYHNPLSCSLSLQHTENNPNSNRKQRIQEVK